MATRDNYNWNKVVAWVDLMHNWVQIIDSSDSSMNDKCITDLCKTNLFLRHCYTI